MVWRAGGGQVEREGAQLTEREGGRRGKGKEEGREGEGLWCIESKVGNYSMKLQ